ncbi:MAG: LptF/LptG family permease [Bdellovibrionales bacterium]|nr:LptF/LptG family permease [Bdellovibrionales bacterium]
MGELARGRLAIKYIFLEMVPSFVLGNLIFVFILLMFQALRLTEFILVHGVKVAIVMKIVIFLSVSFLPVILPMSLLFSILLTYGRLSSDSEIVAFKSLGLNMFHLSVPAFLLALLTFFVSAQTSFYIAPWGNRQFELLISELGRAKATANFKEGVFSQSFFDLVIYANEVDSKSGLLRHIFIYDERDSNNPLTIIAETGQVVSKNLPTGQFGLLRLNDGSIHRTNKEAYTKVNFGSYDINLFNPLEMAERKKSFQSLNIDEVREELTLHDVDPKRRISLQIEWHRRWALSIACFIFAMLGVGLGTTTNKRASKGSGFVLSISVVVAYWLMYVTLESMAKSEKMSVPLAIWSINIAFFIFGVRVLKKASRQ